MSCKLDKSILRSVVVMVISVMLAACAAGAKKDTTASIDKRAIERWNLLITGKAEKAYDYLSPGYRATKPRKTYAEEMNSRPVLWKSATFLDKECKDDACDIRISVEFSVKMNVTLGAVSTATPIHEKWVRIDGQWFLLPESFAPTTSNKGLR